MFQVLTIVLAIAFSVSNVPPQTGRGETQGPSITAPGDQQIQGAIDPPENTAIDPPENTGG